MALLFDESYYLNAKLEQLHAKGETDASGKPYTMESLVKAISDAGLTPYSHYTQYGCREGLDPSSVFDQSYYLASKLAQLHSTGEMDANGNAYTMESLTATLAAQGMSPLQHYLQFGRDEGLNPNAWFNESEYLNAKLAQLHSTGETDANGDPYTLASLRQAISDAGMTPLEHYEQFGHAETNADGTLINPSNAFDANAYVAAKLYQLQTTGSSEEQTAWADKSPADVLAALEDASLSPVSHYVQYGADEANAAGVALVQTVPSEQRVSNDPLRNDLGQNVPSNYNDPTPGPDAAEAAPVTKPADMGGLAAESISPGVVPPEAPVAVPGDDAYVAPTPGTVDTNETPVVPETDPDSGLLVLPDAEPEPEPEPGTPGGGTSPSDPSFSVNETEDGISFTGVKDNSISLNVDENGTATFTSGGESATVEGFSSITTITLGSGQTLTADLADLDGLTVTGGTVEGRLEQTTTDDFSTDSGAYGEDGWTTDRDDPKNFAISNGVLTQTIAGPNNDLNADFYATQGKQHTLPDGTTSMSINLEIPSDWLTPSSEGKDTRWAGFWGVAKDSSGDISGYPIIEFAIRDGQAGFYGWETEGEGEWPVVKEIDKAGTYNLRIEMNEDGTFSYFVNDEKFYTTDQPSDPSVELSAVILQGYSYQPNNTSFTAVDKEYTITWDDLTTTAAASVTKNLDLSGIEHLTGITSLSVDKDATLTINAEQANDLIIIGEGDVEIDAADATEGVEVNTVAWAGSSDNWYNDKGFADGQLAKVTGGSEGDFFSLDLADIGTLTEEGDSTISFKPHESLSLDGGDGDDTLMLTWFAPKGNEGHTLEKLDADFFGHIKGFETIIFNKGNKSNNLEIDASSLGTNDDPVTLMLMSSGTIEGIHDGLVIGFTEPELNQDVNFQLSAANQNSMLTLDIGTTNSHAINLSKVTNISTIVFQGEENIELDQDEKTISCSSPDGNWKVILSGVDDGSSLSLADNILTIGGATGV
ncbi:hypothetical protein [uncultured Desulfovibrio sp.]|uniref:hypothetical protein n=1 Tax=uncultured Desulfovibrio sp. TaxID=167968 RepID=UPI0025FBE9BD|nr:hypothetical protein [uncultured Desulfovibrio sp.]